MKKFIGFILSLTLLTQVAQSEAGIFNVLKQMSKKAFFLFVPTKTNQGKGFGKGVFASLATLGSYKIYQNKDQTKQYVLAQKDKATSFTATQMSEATNWVKIQFDAIKKYLKNLVGKN